MARMVKKVYSSARRLNYIQIRMTGKVIYIYIYIMSLKYNNK